MHWAHYTKEVSCIKDRSLLYFLHIVKLPKNILENSLYFESFIITASTTVMAEIKSNIFNARI